MHYQLVGCAARVPTCSASHAVTSGAVPAAAAPWEAGGVLGVDVVMSVCISCADAPGKLMANDSSTSRALGSSPKACSACTHVPTREPGLLVVHAFSP